MAGSPSTSARSSRVLSFPKGQFYIQSPIADMVLDIESGFLKDPLKAGARVELAYKKSPKHNAEASLIQQEQQQWRTEDGYIINTRTGHVLDIQGGVVRSGTRVIQNVRKTGKDAAGQQWLNDDGVLTLASNPKFVITIDGDATRDGTRITIQEKKPYYEKQKWLYLNGFDTRPMSPSPSRAESISIRPDNFPTSWFYIKSAASGLVIDIEHGYFTDPMKAGARAEMNHQKIDNGDGRHSLLELQLWRYEAGFLINRRTGFVLDIQGGTLKLAARVVQWQRKSGKEAQNQHWFYENGFIANVYNSRLVLDIDGDGSKDGAKIAIGERKDVSNADQKWVLEEVRYQWLANPTSSSASLSSNVTEEVTVVDRGISSPKVSSPPTTVSVLPTSGWFYIKSQSSGLVVDVEQDADPLAPNVLVSMNTQITSVTEENQAKVESQLWRYVDGQIINRRSQLVLDCKQGVVRYGARLMQGIPKQGKEALHQRWESSNGTLVIQGKPLYAIDIEGDGTKNGARLSLQRPKVQNNLDQQWTFQMATFEWLKVERVVTRTFTETTITSSKVVPIEKNDWFFIKSGATGLVMDLEAGWITQPTDVGAYISMKKQRSLEESDRALLERQLWRYEDGYLINRRTNFVIDIYGRSAVVGVKLIQQHKATTEADGKINQLWNVVDGNIQLLHNPKLVINVESNKDGSRVQLVEHKAAQTTIKTWTLELTRASWLKQALTRSSTIEELEEAQITVHAAFPQDKWFYVKCKASGLVLDIEHGFWRDHTKAGANIELNNQKLYGSSARHALLELQLWRFENGFIINRRTGLVLDVSGNEFKTGTKIIQWSRKTEGNANQQWAVSNGFIHLKSQPNFVLDVDGDGTRDGARISLGERKDKKNLDQRWSFEAVSFSWLTSLTSYTYTTETDEELLKEYESSHLARVKEHQAAPIDCWFYLKSGISDLVLEVEHSRQVNHLKSGAHIQLAHQKLKSGKHSHALLELQLWRFQDGYIINRRSGLVLSVDGLHSEAKLIQSTKSGAETQRWVVEEGVLRLAAHRKFALFLSYGRQGARAFIREVRRNEVVQRWSFAEVRFSWLTLERTVSEVEEEQLDILNESEISYLKRELVQTRQIEHFTKSTYFYIRASNGNVVDIEHGLFKNHMKAGAYATLHPQTTAASANQHALLDIQLWSHHDGYLINKRTGLALTVQGDAQANARLVQELPQNAMKWTLEGGYIYPSHNSNLVISIRNDEIILIERSLAVTWTVYEVSFTWLVWTEITLLTVEQEEDVEFYEEFEEVVVRSSARSGEVIEYAVTEQHVVAPKESWFYLVAGSKVVSIHHDQITEKGCDGASISLVAQKRFSSAQRHALLELQLWKFEDSYIINRYTGLYLTVDSFGALITTTKQTDVARQQWHFSEDGSLSLVSSSSQVVDFVNDSAVLVERSAGKTIWLYDTIKTNWLTSMESSTRTDYKEIQTEITEYRTVYTRYVQYITKYTITTTTTTRTTRRIVRVNSQSSLQNATVYEQGNTTWACHLVEAGTGVEYVMQLLQDNTTSVYYIYTQWGSTGGVLEGPYESIDKATTEFQELFQSKVGVEWTEREVAISGSWTSVEFEYDTINVEDESAQAIGATKTSKTTKIVNISRSLVDDSIPNADQITVYYDENIYHTILEEKSTGVMYVNQLLYNHVTKTYYVYLRSGETEYILDGPYDNVEVAKAQFVTKYSATFGFSWEERKTITNTKWHVVQQTFETQDEYLEYVSDEEEVDVITTIGAKETIQGSTDHVTVVHQSETTVSKPVYNQTDRVTETATAILVSQPKTIKNCSWFRTLATGAGVAAVGALTQVDGVWKRTLNVITKHKGHVDAVAPVSETSVVYYDETDVYDSVLIEKSTGITYITQLIFDTKINKYYVYYRYGEKAYKLDGPHETVEAAKEAFQVTYKENFGLEWSTRETTVSEQWTYEFRTYETYEVIEEVEEILEEEEAQVIIEHERSIHVDETTVHTEVTNVTTAHNVVQEDVREDIVVANDKIMHKETVVAKTDEEKIKVDVTIDEIVKEVEVVEKVEQINNKHTTTTETGVIAKPAINKNTSWFRRAANSAAAIASGAGAAASCALVQVDGVWKRTIEVVNARKARVDEVSPIAKTSVVYYDETDVYDSVLIEKSTGITYITQLIFDTKINKYYVYYRYGEKAYKLDGPHETVEAAKEAFQVTYKEKFGLEWETRETTVSEKWTYEVKTYEVFEEIEYIEEIVEEEEAKVIIAREKVFEEEKNEDTKGTIIVHEDVQAVKPAVSKGSSWLKKAVAIGAGATAVGVGAVVAGAVVAGSAAKHGAEHVASGAHHVASGAGSVASGALEKVDGVWKRTVQVLTTRKAHVDKVAPIAETSYVYYDDEVYDSVLTEKSTGVTYITQLLYDESIKKYYVYIRWGETDYKLDGPHETVESAKVAFKTTYHERFGLEWETRETTVSEQWTYEVKTYEVFEEIEYVEEVYEEEQAQIILQQEKEIVVSEDVTVHEETTTVTEEEITHEHTETTTEVVVEETQTEKVAKPAVSKGSSWFKKAVGGVAAVGAGAAAIGVGAVVAGAGAVKSGASHVASGAHHVASGAGSVASGALEKVDGVWKRTVQVLTTRKAHVDKVAPIAETSYVYYDDEVYDSVLTEKSTGVTYITQLLYDTKVSKYYVYVRWGETDYKLDGPHDTIESAKSAFQVTYKERFGLEWETRETTVSEQWTYEVQTYETYEEVEYVEEIVEEEQAQIILQQEKEIVVSEDVTVHEETTTVTEEEITHEHTETTTEVVVEETQTEEVTEVVVETEVAKPAVSKGSSWFKKAVGGVAAVGAGAAAIGVGAVVAGAGAVKSGASHVASGAHHVASGAGHAASGALEKVDGVWKRTVQVLTTRKAHVDKVAPIAETSYVYYDDEVYDSVLTEKSTGVTYITQLLYDTKVSKYYVYVRWGETDYKLDGPHDTIESAKSAFQVTYKERFGLEWETRETTVSEQWTYEVQTYETYEEVEYVEEIVEEEQAQIILQQEKEIVVSEDVTVHEEATTVTEEEITHEHTETKTEAVVEETQTEEVTEVVVETEVAKPAVSKGSSWFKKAVGGVAAVGAGAVAVGVGAVAVTAGAVVAGGAAVAHGAHHVASGAGHAASGALEKVDGVWKRTVQVLTTRKAHVDKVAPIAETSYVYYDDEVYDSVLTEKSTGVTYITQLLYDTKVSKYYVYVRWGETDYKLDGPHDTIESAKSAFQVTYKERFGLEWETRETTVSEQWTYEVQTYETYEEVEYVEEIVEEEQAQIILQQEKEIIVSEDVTVHEETTTVTEEEVTHEHSETTTEVVVEETQTEEVTEVVAETEVAKPAVSKGSSWFKKAVGGAVAVGAGAAAIGVGAVVAGAGAVKSGASQVASGAHHVASGAGSVASGALEKVDGVWKRTVQVLTTRKAHVDKVAPIAETSYVYYDDEVYDSVLTENSTGVTYITQLLYDTKVSKYYVYVRWGETDYKLDGPHDTIESAKSAFQVTYKERFGLEWETRETTVSEQWTYEVQTYETYEEVEYVEEIVEEEQAQIILQQEKEIVVSEDVTVHEETTTVTEEEITHEHTETTTEVDVEETHTEEVTEVVVETEVAKPAVSKGSSWFKKAVGGVAAVGAGAVAVGVGAVAVTAGAVVAGGAAVAHGAHHVASGAGHAASGALEKVDGVWKRTVQVLTTRKAHVDKVAPIAETSYVYYDDEVYDSVLTEKSTGVTYITQLLYDTKVSKYYVYVRWGETDYKLDGPHDTIESAKSAFQVTYKERFGLEWETRETTVSEQWTYEVQTYETYEEVEYVEEIVEEEQAQIILQQEKEIVVSEDVTVHEEATTVTEEEITHEHTETKTEAVVEETQTEKVAKPAVSKGSSWFKKAVGGVAAVGAGAAAIGVGAVVAGAGAVKSGASHVASGAHHVASGAGSVASGALEKVDGVWKRTVQVLTTRKAHVDKVAPIAETSYVYYDDEVYDSVLTEKSTGVTYITQLLYDTKVSKYYVYVRWGETDYELDGPHDTIESAKSAFQVTYKERFGLEWETRETTVSEQWTYEVQTYETYEEVEYIEEIVEEEQAQIILQQEKEIVVSEDVTVHEETTTVTEEEITHEHTETTTEVVVEEETQKETVVAEVVVEADSSKPAVSKGSSWFKKAVGGVAAVGAGAAAIGVGAVVAGAGAVKSGASHVASGAHHVASGAGSVASGALEKVDGVWKRTVQVLTTRKAHVDKVAPIAETSYVYYDDEVYDSVLTEKSTGVTYITQLLYDTKVSKYYVYVRWGETDYKLDGPHDTIESAKSAFQVTYKERFGLEWETRETTISEQWTYEVKTYETFEEVEYVEEVVEEKEAEIIIKREQETIVSEDVTVHEETTTVTEEEITHEHTETTTEVVVEETQTEEVTEVVVETEVAKPAVSKGSSWFKKAVGGVAAVGAGAVAVGVGAVAVTAGAVVAGGAAVAHGAHHVASGAGHAASGALEKVDGVWKRTVQVLTTRKAHVDKVAPIAETSYVYYDDEVYDSVLTEKSTGVTYITQLLYDTKVSKYYVYVRWGETDYKLDGPHDTIESAKSAFQVTYKERFGLEWETRETTVSEQWTYEVQTYETYEEVEYVEEIVEEEQAQIILQQEKEIVVSEDVTVHEEATTVTEEEITHEHTETKTEAVVKETQTEKVAKPAVSKGSSWFKKAVGGVAAVGAGAAAIGVGAVVAGAGAVKSGASHVASGAHHVASGAGHAASGALEKVDGVWKRTVQVLTTRKAHVDKVAPIAETSYVYYDDEVYDSVLTEKSTGVTYITQLLYDTKVSKYYVYVRWGETDYKLDGPHDTIDSAKSAFQVTYKERFGLEWETRETTVSEQWTYEVQTYETYEEVEYIEEIVEEEQAQIILQQEKEIVVSEDVTVHEETTTVTEEEITHEHTETTTEVVVEETQTEEVAKPAVSKGSSWFKKAVGGVAAVGAGAAAIGVGAVVAGAGAVKSGASHVASGAHHVASGAGSVASGALEKVDGVWKRTVQVLTTRKAHVDKVAPIAETSYVYYDDEVYDSVLTEKSTGVTYITQLLYDTKVSKYYVYVRWGETDYKLDGPHDTIESAKSAFQVTYKERFGLEWETRETTVSEQWTYEVQTYETYEEVEYVEEIVEEEQAQIIIQQEKEIVVSEDVTVHEETTTVTEEEVTHEHTETTTEVVVEETQTEEVTEVVVETEVAKPAVSKGSSWFKKAVGGVAAVGAGAVAVGVGAVAVTAGAVVAGGAAVAHGAHHVASGAGHAASGALEKVDGVWKRTVQVLTTRKAHVDKVAPIAETSYVYYDDEVYDSVLTEKSTGVTYITQLLYDTKVSKYYVYVRWGETDYKLDGPHDTIESAKSAFQVTYKERFGLEWETRETTVSEQWTYEVKTYETFEEVEYVEEVVEEKEAEIIIKREQETIVSEDVTVHEETTTVTEEVTHEHTETTTEVVVEETQTEEVTEVVVETEVAKPAVSKGSSWFKKAVGGVAAVGAGAVAVGVGAVAVTAGAVVAGGAAVAHGAHHVASGAGHAASGALEKVDGVWKRTVQVLTTRKAHVDKVAPIAETSYVYYDDEVYDSVLTEKSTGVTYITQLLYDTKVSKYYVYVRWGETDYKLDGPHDTIESAKSAFQVTYKERFGLEWETRETTVSEQWTYEVQTYETYEEVEYVEEIVEEEQAQIIIQQEKEIVVSEDVTVHEETTTVTEEEITHEHTETTTEVVVEEETQKETVVAEVVVEADSSKPAVSKGSSWFKKAVGGVAAVGAGAAAIGVGAVVAGAGAVKSGASHVASGAHHVASGAGSVASGALEKVDGVWKRTVQVLTTRKAHVDKVAPIAETSYVYYDDEVYDSVLTEKSTGVTYITQLLYDTKVSKYYVYVRWGETDYKLDGPHDTIESAKSVFLVTYKERFGLEWETRETTVSEHWTYEVKTYETFEEVEYVEEVVEEKEAEIIIKREQETIVSEDVTVHEETTTVTEEVTHEHTETTTEVVVEETQTEEVTEVVAETEVAKPAVSKGSSWFKKAVGGVAAVGAGAAAIGVGAVVAGAGAVKSGASHVASGAHHVASGAGSVASGALEKVDGVWKRTVQVLTTRKAHVDKVAPIAETSYVYYDDEVYDSVLTEKSTGVTYITQLLYDTKVSKYYVYVRWGETDYELDGPHDTIESAKSAFQVTYKERFGLEWETRETTVSEQWTYEVQTYETYEEVEYVEEIVEEEQAQIILQQEKEIVVSEDVTVHEETTTVTEEEITHEHTETTTEVVVEETQTEEVTEVVVETEVAKPAVSKGSSWFKKAVGGVAAVGAGAVAVGVGAVAVTAGAVVAGGAAVAHGAHHVASGAGHAASGALEKVDGVWKRTVQVLTTRKAHVDKVAPIAETSYVYYDDEVYDSVLTEKSTGVTYITQLLYDTKVSKYYVYVRWGETDYKLDGPHDTIESAKSAFQVTYKERFGLEWETRETTVSEHWTYEVKTYETFEEVEYVEEVVEEKEAEIIIKREQETIVSEDVTVHEETTTVTEEVTHEHTETTTEVVVEETQTEEVTEVVAETEVVKPAVSKGSSWFKKAVGGVAAVGAGAVAVGVGAVAVTAGAVVAGGAAVAHGAHHVASGAGHAASGALEKVDGVWKRTVQVLTTRKAHVDKIAPIAETSYVYYDDEVYDSVLTEKSTGVTYITQLLYDTKVSKYYVYVRWGETDYKLDGPHDTIESAKSAFQVTYKERFGLEWETRETTVSEQWTYEVKTYETYEEVEYVEEIVEEEQAQIILQQEKEIVVSEDVTVHEETTTVTEEEVTHEHTETTTEVVVEETQTEEVTEVVVETEVAKPAVSKGSSWFKKAVGGVAAVGAGAAAIGVGAVVAGAGAVKSGASHVASGAHHVASGAGHAASGALEKVDGVWKRTVQVLTTRKAHVDKVAPIAETSYVYYDDEVYDSVLTEKSTGVTYITQLLYDTKVSKYYVYVRWGETDYKLDGPHDTIESAKSAFQVTYKERFGLEWETRETTVSEQWTYEVKTYETYEEVEYIEEIVEEEQAQIILQQEKEIVVSEDVTVHEETTTVTEEEVTHEHTETTTEVVVEETQTEEVTEVVVETEVAKPAVSKGSSWFKKAVGGVAAVGAGAAAIGVGAVVAGAGAVKSGASHVASGAHHVASGAGHAASGALEKVDGVWKRTVQVLTTRKAHVDKVAPIAETSYVYYDDEVYDSVLTEKSTGVTYITQLLYDTKVSKYYVYVRWGETDYKLDGPHDTIESAKSAFQVTYKERFGLEWETRETTVSEQWTYEVKTYETFEEVEYVEEVVEEKEAEIIIKREQETIVSEDVTVHEETTTVTEEVTHEHTETTTEVVVEETQTEEVTEVVVETEVAKPAVSKGSSWFKKAVGGVAAVGAGAVAVGVGAVAVTAGAVVAGGAAVAHGAHHVASGAGHAASGALEKVDGVWKRTVQVLTTRKAHVDKVAPIAETSYVYYDDEVYDSVLTEKSTGVTYITQLLYDTKVSKYYVYVRWGETDYKLDGPHDTIESAKAAFLISYRDQFGIEWESRETTVSERWTYEVKTYETYEEIEVVEEIVDETEAVAIIEQEREIIVQEQSEHVAVTEGEEIVKIVTTVEETGVVAQPAVAQGASWFRRLASGAGAVASGALTQVDGVWKRTVEVLTTRKAHVDKIAPIAETSYVYYDDEVYDSVLTEKSTGVTYITQLLYDTKVSKYYVYVRWGETDYKLDGPHDTIESAKSAFLVTYKERFGLEWETRETTVSEQWTYEVKTYETFEETEYIEEVVEDYEVKEIVAREKQVIVEDKVVSTEQSVSSSHDDTVVRTVSEQVVSQEGSASSANRGGAFGFGGSSSYEYTQTQSEQETKKSTFLANLPTLNAGINADTGAAIGVIDLTSGTAEALRELPAHLRPRAWVSLHVGGWQDAPHELQGFMRLDDQSGQRLMETARDEAQGKAQESTPIDNLSLPEIVGLFAQKLYGHFGEELPKELDMEKMRDLARGLPGRH